MFFFDGYILNQEEVCQRQKTETWEKAFVRLIEDEKCPKSLRGAFCGFWGEGNSITLFVDHMGNRGLYFYCQDNILIFSSKFYFIIELLKYHHIELTVSEQAIKYMLEQGFMLEDTTFAKEIHRVCPGEIVNIQDYKLTKRKRYFLIDNTFSYFEMSEEEVIEKVDCYFRQAVKREFDKDIEYGYKHLVELSGGLDSSWTMMLICKNGLICFLNKAENV